MLHMVRKQSRNYMYSSMKKKRECDIFIKKKEKINNNNNKHTIMMLNIIKQCATRATRRAGYVNKRFMSFSYPSPRTLAEHKFYHCLEAEDANGIKTQETHHDAQETCISGTMTGTQYDTLFKRLAESQYFVLPVKKRMMGHFILLSQAQEKHILFTYLEDLKITLKLLCHI